MMKQKNSSKGLLKAKLRESSAANSKISLVTGKFKTMAKYGLCFLNQGTNSLTDDLIS